MTKPNNKPLGHIQLDIDNNKSNKKKNDYKENKENKENKESYNNIKSLVPKRHDYKIGKKTNHRSKPSIPKTIEKTKKSTIPKIKRRNMESL